VKRARLSPTYKPKPLEEVKAASARASRAGVTGWLAIVTVFATGLRTWGGVKAFQPTNSPCTVTLHLTDNDNSFAAHANNTHRRLTTATSANMALKRINKVRRRRRRHHHQSPPCKQVQPR